MTKLDPLPKESNTAQKAEVAVDNLIHGEVDTVETNARYLAYLARARTLVSAGQRYLAYTSDVGNCPFKKMYQTFPCRGPYIVYLMKKCRVPRSCLCHHLCIAFR